MPALSNLRWEQYCQNRAAGMPNYKSYQQAGFDPKHQKSAANLASKLAQRPEIKDRIREIITNAAGKMKVTVESIAAELDEAFEMAHQQGQASAMVAASQAKAKLFGLGSENQTVTHNTNYDRMTEQELMFELASIHAEVRAFKLGKKVQN